MRVTSLAVGADGRNRFLYWPQGTISQRCAPSSNRSVLNSANWLRFLIRPFPGRAIAYIDWSAQEFLIAAVLSGDPRMLAAYFSGDAYIGFARLANPRYSGEQLVAARAVYKRSTLGIGFGMGIYNLAAYIGRGLLEAKILRDQFWTLFCRYGDWRARVIQYAHRTKLLETGSGWPLHIVRQTSENTIANFLIQATASELMRLALRRLHKAGITVIGTLHDAFLIEAIESQIEEAVHVTRTIMADVSRHLLQGRELRSKVQFVRASARPGDDRSDSLFPDRLGDERGLDFWQLVLRLLTRRGVLEPEKHVFGWQPGLAT